MTTQTNAPSPLLSEAGDIVIGACWALLIEVTTVALVAASWRTIR